MVIAGEASGDLLAAELVQVLREELAKVESLPTADYQPLHASLDPRFFGAGGPRLAGAGAELAFDLTSHAVVGLSDVLKNLLKFRRFFRRLYAMAREREPDAIICVDFSGFNRRFAHAVKTHVRRRQGWFHDWRPKIIQYISPQVWASREARVYQVARDFDLVLSIFPFEKEWYARRVPKLRVEFVGHPITDRYRSRTSAAHKESAPAAAVRQMLSPLVILLPGSRGSELRYHLPVLAGALDLMRSVIPELRARMVLPNAALVEQAKASRRFDNVEIQSGGLAEALVEASVALASTGTVTMECAYFGVPTVTLYKMSWSNYEVGRRLVKVRTLTMPNLLANEEVFPEFIQAAATPQNIGRAALELLRGDARRQAIRAKLQQISGALGGGGANRRAAQAIIELLRDSPDKTD